MLALSFGCTRASAMGFLAFAAVMAASLESSVARAHLGSTKYLRVERTEDGADVTVSIERVDAGLTLGLGLEPSDDDLRSRSRLLEASLLRDLRVGDATGGCAGDARTTTLASRDGRRFVEVAFAFQCTDPSSALRLRDDSAFADDPGHQAIVSVVQPDGVELRVLRADTREVVLDRETDGAFATAGRFLLEGAHHLAIGLDHLLFLMSLLLGGRFFTRRDGTRSALVEAALLTTAFTVGHSISLILSTLDVVSLPSQPVEVAIAASIVLVALQNLLQKDGTRKRTVLTLAFGVVHGFGFASVLSDIGLSRAERVVALLSFNVGIEVAQLAFVAVMVALLSFVASSRWARVISRSASLAIALLAAFWVVERALGA